MKRIKEESVFKLLNNQWISAIRSGLLKLQGLIFITCMISVIINLTSLYDNDMIHNIWGHTWKVISNNINNLLVILVNLLPAVTISYSLVELKNNSNKFNKVDPLFISILAFFNVIHNIFLANHNVNYDYIIVGAFFSIIIAILTTECYIYYEKLIRSKFKGLSYNYEKDFRESINSIMPTSLTMVTLLILKYFILPPLFTAVTQLLMTISLFVGANAYLNYFIYTVIIHFLRFIGVNGGNFIHSSFYNKVFSADVVDKTFLDVFINLGGSGVSLGLILAILLFTRKNKDHQLQNVVKLSFFPALFNINGMLIYGLSILFNPIYLIPFIIAPLTILTISFIALQIGFIPNTLEFVDWKTPIFLSGYQSTGSINGIILQLVNVLVSGIIYYPFIKLAHKFNHAQEETFYNKLKQRIFSEEKEYKYLTNQNDHINYMTHLLGYELKNNIRNNEQLFLVYQPQVNKDKKVVGVEALIRWNHPEWGFIPPNVIVTVAEELNLIDELGMWVIKEAAQQLHEWNKIGIYDLNMSVNISNLQLRKPEFALQVICELETYHINPKKFTIEITESISLGKDQITKTQINQLVDYGVEFAIDDFGKGYNPILYLKEYSISCIKLDGSLIKDITRDQNSKYIVSAMYQLCQNSGIDIVCEFVETEEQCNILDSFGNGIYQGYLFSAPLSELDCIDYIRKQNSL